MWLINTTTLDLEEFQTCPSGTYAILSHRWEEEELSFDEFRAGKGRNKKSFRKVQKCCEQARRRSLNYAWIDTCCIDKRSSAELSEAINSMYQWYAGAEECYVYMSDVPVPSDDLFEPTASRRIILPPQCGNTQASSDTSEHLSQEYKTAFLQCRWFTRGWTLQELLAPANLYFFDNGWNCLGNNRNLVEEVSKATGIERNVLLKHKELEECSIAERMSWAASRVTTRTEDVAYCLLDIFGVNMPLLYGEGESAFQRLQEVIIQQSDDESIFAWSGVSEDGSGLLASTPYDFRYCGNVMRHQSQERRSAFSMTNRGLSIACELMPCAMNTYCFPIQSLKNCVNCGVYQTCIYLCRTVTDDQYIRVAYQGQDVGRIVRMSASRNSNTPLPPASRPCGTYCGTRPPPIDFDFSKTEKLYVPQLSSKRVQPVPAFRGFAFYLPEDALAGYSLRKLHKNGKITAEASCLFDANKSGSMLIVQQAIMGTSWCAFSINLGSTTSPLQRIEVNFDFNFHPICTLKAATGSILGALGDWETKGDVRHSPEGSSELMKFVLTGDRLTGIQESIIIPKQAFAARTLVQVFLVAKPDLPTPAWEFRFTETPIAKMIEERLMTDREAHGAPTVVESRSKDAEHQSKNTKKLRAPGQQNRTRVSVGTPTLERKSLQKSTQPKPSPDTRRAPGLLPVKTAPDSDDGSLAGQYSDSD